MATFQVQVEGLTSLSVGTTPTVLELDQFLIDGVLDVTSRWLVIHPEDRELFMDETGLQVAQGADVNGAEIISVVRADGVTAGDFRPCRKISPAQQTQVLDTESLSFASKYHPVYMLSSDTTVKVFPVPSDNSGKDSYKIYYVNNIPKDSGGGSLTSADSALGYFPADRVYLVVLYASMRSLQANMGATTISDLSITAVPPDTPTIAVSTVSFSQAAPAYDTTVATSALTEANNFIDSDEDVELANAKLAEVQALMRDELNAFNDANIEYQGQLQISIQNAQLEDAEEAKKLQKYAAELQVYQGEVATQVQEYTQNVQADGRGYQWLQGQYTALKAEYDAAFMIAEPQQQPQQQVRR